MNGGGDALDWIERLFHVSPDGGSGMTELMLIIVPALLAAVGILARRARWFKRGRRKAGAMRGQ